MAVDGVEIFEAAVQSRMSNQEQKVQSEKRKEIRSPAKSTTRSYKKLDNRVSGRKKKFLNNLDAFVDAGSDNSFHATANINPVKKSGIRSDNLALFMTKNDRIDQSSNVSQVRCTIVPLNSSKNSLACVPHASPVDHYISVSSSSSECSDSDGFDLPPRSIKLVSEIKAVPASTSTSVIGSRDGIQLSSIVDKQVGQSSCDGIDKSAKPVRSASPVIIVNNELVQADPYDAYEDRVDDPIWYSDFDEDAGSSTDAGDITLIADRALCASPDAEAEDNIRFEFSHAENKRHSATTNAQTIQDLLCFDNDSCGNDALDADRRSNASSASSLVVSDLTRSDSTVRRPVVSPDRLTVQLERAQEKQRRAEQRVAQQEHAHASAVERLTNKARQNAYNQLNKWKKTQVAEHTVPVIDARLFQQFGRKDIAVLKEYCTVCRTADNRVPNSVLFMQQNMQFDVLGGNDDDDEDGSTEASTQNQRRVISSTSSTEERELDEMLLQLPLDDFIHLVYNNHHSMPDIRNQTDPLPSAGSSTGAPRTPVAYYRWLKARLPRKRITLFVCGLESYFKQMSNNGGTNRRRAAAIDSSSSSLVIAPSMVDATLATLQCFCHVTLHFVENSDDLAKFVGRMTRALEKRPLLHAKQHLYTRCMGAGAAQARIVVRSCDVRTDDALPKLWAQQLAQFPAASAAHAAVVCLRYAGGLPSLMEYYRNQRRLLMQTDAELHLANEIVQERVRKNGVVMRRRFGAELSRQLYRFYCVDAPGELLKVPVDEDEPTVIQSVLASDSQQAENLIVQTVLETSRVEDIAPQNRESSGQTRRQQNSAVVSSTARTRADRVPGGTVATLRALANDFHLDIDDEAFENLRRKDQEDGRPTGTAAQKRNNFYYAGRGGYGVNGWRGRAAYFRGRAGRRGSGRGAA